MIISYKINEIITPEQTLEIYQRSGLQRPKDAKRVKNMVENANVIITAWHNGQLVGLLRALTDFSFDCYINDIAVDLEYQHKGIGRTLVDHLKPLLDQGVLIFLIANPDAADFYSKLGFTNNLKKVGEPFIMVNVSDSTEA